MADSGAIRAGRAFIELFADGGKVDKELTRIQARFNTWGKSMTAAGKGIFSAGAAIWAPLATATTVFTQMGTALAEGAVKTGISVEALSQLKYAAEQSGVSLESLEGSTAKMQKTLADAAKGGEEGTKALRAVGLSFKDLRGLSPDKQFERLATAIAHIPNPAQRTAAAMGIFGKSGDELMPLLERGADGIESFRREADRLGLTMSSQDAKSALDFGRSLKTLWAVVEMGIAKIGGALVPVLKSWTDYLTKLIGPVRQFIETHKQLVPLVAGIATGLVVAGAALVGFGYVFTGIGAGIGAFATVMTGLAPIIGAIISPIGLVAVGAAAAAAAFLYLTDAGRSIRAALSSAFSGMLGDALKAFGGIKDAIMSGDWSTAGQILWTFLQIQFTRGEGMIKQGWIELKGYLLKVWDTLKAEFPAVIYGWGAAIAKFAVAAVEAFTDLFAAIKRIWANIQRELGGVVLRHMAREDIDKRLSGPLTAEGSAEAERLFASNKQFDSEADKEKYIERHKADFVGMTLSENDKQDLAALSAKQMMNPDTSKSEYQSEIDAARKTAEARIQAITGWSTQGQAMTPAQRDDQTKADQQKVQNEMNASIAKTNDQVAALQGKLGQQVTDAQTPGMLKDIFGIFGKEIGEAARGAFAGGKLSDPNMFKGLDHSATAKKAAELGTFNPFAVGGMLDANPMVHEQKQTNMHLRKLIDATRDGNRFS